VLPLEFKERRTASCQIGQDIVYVKANPDPMELKAISTISLHEALCAIGYKDDIYQMSVALSILAELNEATRIRLISSALFRWLPSEPENRLTQLAFAGGISSIGGGGDITAARIKYNVIVRKVSKQTVNESFILSILNTPFEPSADGHEMSFKIAFGEGPYFRIWVPVTDWELYPEKRNLILDNILSVMNSVFADIDNPYETIFTCGEDGFTMPKHRSEAMEKLVPKLIQDFRAFHVPCSETKK
jgi:hypothetical protein